MSIVIGTWGKNWSKIHFDLKRLTREVAVVALIWPWRRLDTQGLPQPTALPLPQHFQHTAVCACVSY